MSGTNGIADWTIMVYISADDGLANFAIESLRRVQRKANSHVIVSAQFGFDNGNGSQQIRRYVFDRQVQPDSNPRSLVHDLVQGVNAIPKNLTTTGILTDFVDFTFEKYKAKHYALILWGHGPELLFQLPSSNGTNGKRLYLTPIQLRMAIEETAFHKEENSFDIIGFDACALSMIEMAYELKGLAKYMVASQGDVPDLSFPYDSLLRRFHDDANNGVTDSFLEQSVRDYALAYEDYICSPGTSMKNTTLSCLKLESLGPAEQNKAGQDGADANKGKTSIIDGVNQLADALLKARKQPGLPDVLIAARQASIGFAGGLWVDLFTFSEQLFRRLKASAKIDKDDIAALQAACLNIQKALTVENPSSCVVANAAEDPQCHGVSIYFPYLSETDAQEMQQPLVKTALGSTGGIKGLTGALNQIATSARFDLRQLLIEDSEDYYPQLKFAAATGWYSFIGNQWSRILAMNADYLDTVYSAQQCAENLLRNITKLDP